MVRGFVEHGSIFGKGKGFFAKNPEGIRSGLRVDFRKVEGFFQKMTAARPIWPSARPIERPRKADDVDALAARAGHNESYL